MSNQVFKKSSNLPKMSGIGSGGARAAAPPPAPAAGGTMIPYGAVPLPPVPPDVAQDKARNKANKKDDANKKSSMNFGLSVQGMSGDDVSPLFLPVCDKNPARKSKYYSVPPPQRRPASDLFGCLYLF
jgi:hypothetical protein